MVTDPVAFSLGPFTVRWYGILIMLGVLAGSFLAATLARRKGYNPDHLWNMTPFVVIAAIAGARAYWVYLSWDTCCAADPLRGIINIRGGGISIHGAIVFGLLAVWVSSRILRQSFFRWVDIIAPGMALGQAIGRWGNFTNQEAFGGPTDLPWGIPISPQNRPPAYADREYFHPTFLYESVYNLVVCALLTRLALRIDRDHRLRDGDVLWLYLVLYAVGRFAIESLRTDSLMLGPFKAAHVASALALVAGIVGFGIRHLGRSEADTAPTAIPASSATAADPPVAGVAEDDAAPPVTTAGHLAGRSVHNRRDRETPPDNP